MKLLTLIFLNKATECWVGGYFGFPAPGPGPNLRFQFVFNGSVSGPNFCLPTPALNLYLPAPGPQFRLTGPD